MLQCAIPDSCFDFRAFPIKIAYRHNHVLSRPVFDNASYRFNVFLGSWLTAVIVVWGKDNDMPYSFCMQTVDDTTQVQVRP